MADTNLLIFSGFRNLRIILDEGGKNSVFTIIDYICYVNNDILKLNN